MLESSNDTSNYDERITYYYKICSITFQCFCAMTLFYCAHWQAYVTGTLKMGRIDVTEAQYSIIAIHLVSAILGPNFWATQVTSSNCSGLRMIGIARYKMTFPFSFVKAPCFCWKCKRHNVSNTFLSPSAVYIQTNYVTTSRYKIPTKTERKSFCMRVSLVYPGQTNYILILVQCCPILSNISITHHLHKTNCLRLY